MGKTIFLIIILLLLSNALLSLIRSRKSPILHIGLREWRYHVFERFYILIVDRRVYIHSLLDILDVIGTPTLFILLTPIAIFVSISRYFGFDDKIVRTMKKRGKTEREIDNEEFKRRLDRDYCRSSNCAGDCSA